MTDKKQKYAVVVTEFKSQYEEEKLIGWDQTSRKLYLFDDIDQAEEALITLYETQDCDYKVEVQVIGYVGVT